MTAAAGERSYYLDAYADEMMPCDTTLPAWAEWLSKPDVEWPHEIPDDGATFEGSAILWHKDVIATRDGSGGWSLSREPDGGFMAVRYTEGSGWSPDNIVTEEGEFDGANWVATETQGQALLRWLADESECCEAVEFVAIGTHEGAYRFTYRATPTPSLEAERVQ